jgi:hypothetical protein
MTGLNPGHYGIFAYHVSMPARVCIARLKFKGF